MSLHLEYPEENRVLYGEEEKKKTKNPTPLLAHQLLRMTEHDLNTKSLVQSTEILRFHLQKSNQNSSEGIL